MSRYGCQEREKDPRLRISFKRERRTRGNHRAQRFGKVFPDKNPDKRIPPSGRSRRACAENHGKRNMARF